jgi:hypothetical protein
MTEEEHQSGRIVSRILFSQRLCVKSLAGKGAVQFDILFSRSSDVVAS